MRPSFRVSKPFRILIAAAAVCLAAYLAVETALSTRWFHDAVEGGMISRLQSATGARVGLHDLEINPSIFQVTINGLTLRGSEGPSQPPLFTARSLVLRINPLSILRRRLMITWFNGEGITAHLITRADGSTNVPGPRERPGAAVTNRVNLSIGATILQHATLYWNDQRIPLDLTARNSSAVIYHRVRGGYSGSVTSSRLILNILGAPLPPVAVAARIELSDSGISLSQLLWRSPGIAGQGVASLAWSPALHGSASFEVQGEAGPWAQALGWKALRGGNVQLRVQAAYRGGRVSLQGDVRLARVSVRTLPFDPGPMDLSSDFSGGAGGINLTHLKLYALGGTFTGSGAVRFAQRVPKFSIRGRADGLDLARALRSSRRTEPLERLLALSSRLSGDGEASWEGNNFAATFSVTATPPPEVPAGARPVTGAASASIVSRPEVVLTLERAQFATPRSSFSAEGALGAARASLALRYSTTDFREAEPLLDDLTGLSSPIPLELRSAAVFAGVAGGTASDPRIQGQLSVGPFNYGGWAWRSFSGAVNASPEGVSVESGRLRSGPSVFDFSGSAGLADWKVTPHSPLRLSARAEHSPLEGFEDALGIRHRITGLATGELELRGVPSRLNGGGDFRVTGGSAGGEPFDHLSARVLASGGAWDFEKAALRKGSGRLEGWLRLNWPERTFAMQFRGAAFSLADFRRLRPAARPGGSGVGAGAAGKFQGTASFFLEGGGSLSAPTIRSTLNIDNLKAGGDTEGDLAAQIQFASRRLTAAASIRGPDGNLNVSMVAGTDGGWLSQVTGTFSNFRLDPWLNLAGRSPINTPVIASGSISGHGPLKAPREFGFEAKASTLAIMIPGFSVRNAQPVEVRYSNGMLESNRFEMRGPSTALQIHLSARMQNPIEVTLEAHGDAQASLLRLFDPSLQAVGSFSIDLHDSGPVNQPSLAGRIQVQNLSVRYGNLPLPLSGLNGTITLEGNRAVIHSLKEETGQTSIALSGDATIGGSPSFDVQAAFQRVRLEYPAGFASVASGALKLAGTPASALLSGDVTVNGMSASEGFNVVNWVGDMGTSLETPSASPSATFASKVRVNIRIRTNPAVRLDSATLSYVAAIDATIGGTLSQPVAAGEIRIRQGEALIAGNRYQITRGEIAMTNPYQTAPVVDIEARTRVERYDLTVEITGPADRIKMSYRSDPPLSTEDILSLLALGYAPGQTLMSSTGAQRMGAVGAGSLLTTALSTQVSGRFQKLFGVSRLRIDPNLLGPTSAGGARVTIEEQVARDVTVTYSTNTAAAQQRDIRLRWDASDRISLIGERDINGVYGVEVRFHRRLR